MKTGDCLAVAPFFGVVVRDRHLGMSHPFWAFQNRMRQERVTLVAASNNIARVGGMARLLQRAVLLFGSRSNEVILDNKITSF